MRQLHLRERMPLARALLVRAVQDAEEQCTLLEGEVPNQQGA